MPWLLAIGCCAWFFTQAPSVTSADSPVEAPPPRAVSLRESARAAYALLSAGDANAARAVIVTAIASNPNDAGQGWPKYLPPAGQTVSDSAELRSALKAMPELDELVQRRPDVREWLSFAFSGFGSEPVVWDDAPPPPGAEACSGRDGDGMLCVRIRKTTDAAGGSAVPKPGEVLLSHLVFELFNVQNHGSFKELNERARLGSIFRDDYVRGYVALEADAAELARAFFANTLLSASDRSELPALERAGIWWLFADDEYWSDLCDPRKSVASSYPWFPYGTYYDQVTASQLVTQKQYDEALQVLDRVLLVDRLDTRGKAWAHQFASYCHQRLGRQDPALHHATVAVLMYPSADAFECRAGIYSLLGRQQEAADDRRRAELIRLRELLAP